MKKKEKFRVERFVSKGEGMKVIKKKKIDLVKKVNTIDEKIEKKVL